LKFSEKPEILFDMVSDAANSPKWYFTEFTKKASTNVSKKINKVVKKYLSLVSINDIIIFVAERYSIE